MDLEKQVKNVLDVEKKLADYKAELEKDEKFKNFLKMQKQAQENIALWWKDIESKMIESDIKSISGSWGSITVAERLNWKTTDELPGKFYKKVVDTAKLSDTYRLTNKVPKGATPSYSKYLTKRIK